MLIPIAIFVVCLFAGAGATARWLPDLAAGPIGGLTLVAVCGLVGLAVGDVAMHVYLIVEQVNSFGGKFDGPDAASQLSSMAWEAGSLLALATAVYLLGPAPPEAEAATSDPSI